MKELNVDCVVGRTITAFDHREGNEDGYRAKCDVVRITLDDGLVVTFESQDTEQYCSWINTAMVAPAPSSPAA